MLTPFLYQSTTMQCVFFSPANFEQSDWTKSDTQCYRYTISQGNNRCHEAPIGV
jgi:hypothetical protein